MTTTPVLTTPEADVSRKWSGKTLTDHAQERTAFVRQLLEHARVQPGYAVDDGPCEWERTKAGDPDVPTDRRS